VVRLMQQTSAAPAVKERDRECLLDLSDQEIAEAQSQMGETSVDTLLDYLSFMAAADEEVARSATPRFGLEAALVRLATLPKTLPVLELVDRLERLEKKISGGATPARQTQAAAVAPVEKPVTAATMQPRSDPATAWREFVAFVGKQKKLLASHLESATPVELSSQELQIGVAERHHLSYLQDAENAAALRALAQEFFASPLTVGIVAISAENATPPEGNVTQANERTPIVKEALRIFGGSVRTVRRDNG
jgi:DNA polymerase III gamma/tau subunit